MHWIYLLLAGLFEIGWPLGLKLSQTTEKKTLGILLAIAAMSVSGGLLWLAQRQIPLGTAYAVWTGIGAVGTFMVGIWFFGDAGGFGRYLGALLIVSGVITLKLSE
jgi:quaternary ammonium compound-resistance protein SugE